MRMRILKRKWSKRKKLARIGCAAVIAMQKIQTDTTGKNISHSPCTVLYSYKLAYGSIMKREEGKKDKEGTSVPSRMHCNQRPTTPTNHQATVPYGTLSDYSFITVKVLPKSQPCYGPSVLSKQRPLVPVRYNNVRNIIVEKKRKGIRYGTIM
ncbi:hypothetical protein L873DRAFT_969073 [Choiromyces venosus 120613-1]|uniref:Uncharacterized protein n=1 Tax=Choiromyces venosus 120613-1 TaxID=1336337 RepID=A0A3N4JL95_9PEZI|nr:hypothetical protein L873DRAFT_969073 [Choiromyces venosus 120613-1]